MFLVDGITRVVNNITDMQDDSLDAGRGIDVYGLGVGVQDTWTGSNADGTRANPLAGKEYIPAINRPPIDIYPISKPDKTPNSKN